MLLTFLVKSIKLIVNRFNSNLSNIEKTMVTLQNIADELGLSRATVCLALNRGADNTRLNKATCEKIQDTARRLNYRPNALARTMITGKNDVLGFFTTSLETEFSNNILAGILTEATRQRYSIKLLPFDPNNVERTVNFCIEYRLAGVVLHCTNPIFKEPFEILQKELKKIKIPIGIVDNTFKYGWGINVRCNDKNGVIAAVEYLQSLGHKKIAFITSAPESVYSVERVSGYKQAAKHHNIINIDNQQYFNSIVEYIEKNRGLPQFPTAIICCTDFLAFYCLRAIRKAGLSVPEDISVIGFANVSMTQYSDPPLTTVEQSFSEMGKEVVKLLMHNINNEVFATEKKEHILNTKLIIRESTGLCHKS